MMGSDDDRPTERVIADTHMIVAREALRSACVAYRGLAMKTGSDVDATLDTLVYKQYRDLESFMLQAGIIKNNTEEEEPQ